MPRVSKDEVSRVMDFELAEDRAQELGDYRVDFIEIKQDHDLTAVLAGLPDGRCPCPHWGYLFAGEITVHYADHDEVLSEGDAFYMSPGHVPGAKAGSRFIQWSPTDQMHAVELAMAERVRQLQGG